MRTINRATTRSQMKRRNLALAAALMGWVGAIADAADSVRRPRLVDFPEVSTEEVTRLLRESHEVIVYWLGGHGVWFTNRQIRLKAQEEALTVWDAGLDPETPQLVPNRLAWKRARLERGGVDRWIEGLIATRFYGLPKEARIASQDILMGIEIHMASGQVYRWVWRADLPGRFAGSLRALIQSTLKTHLENPDGGLTLALECEAAAEDGSRSATLVVRNAGREKAQLGGLGASTSFGDWRATDLSKEAFDLGAGASRALRLKLRPKSDLSASTPQAPRPVWSGPLAGGGPAGIDRALLVGESCEDQ